MQCHPIGHLHCRQSEKYMAPRQPEAGLANDGLIILCPSFNYEQALDDLAGFERIWLIYWLHHNTSWKPKVATPRGGPKRGVFATRSPHRPNPIGLSCVELLKIEGRNVYIGKHDLINGTPILDIKPYLAYADAFPNSRQGWTGNEAPLMDYHVEWSELAFAQALFIENNSQLELIESVDLRLRNNPFPFPNHRITKLENNAFELAFKTWRLRYLINDKSIIIEEIASGYDKETLQGIKPSRWEDVYVHVEFIEQFRSQ